MQGRKRLGEKFVEMVNYSLHNSESNSESDNSESDNSESDNRYTDPSSLQGPRCTAHLMNKGCHD